MSGWTLFKKSAHTGLPYHSELKRADASPRIRELPSRLCMQFSAPADVSPPSLISAMIFKHVCWMWIQKRLDLWGGTRAKKCWPKWTEMDWGKEKKKNVGRRTWISLERECTWHLNWNWTLNSASHTNHAIFSFCSSILACQYYHSSTGNQQVPPSNKDAGAASPLFLLQEDAHFAVKTTNCVCTGLLNSKSDISMFFLF